MTRPIDKIVSRIKAGEYKATSVDLDEEVVLDRNGERITEAGAIEMAEEALEKLGLRGRPSLSGQRQPSPHISFRVPGRLARRAEKVAASQGKTLSQLGREALEHYLEEISKSA